MIKSCDRKAGKIVLRTGTRAAAKMLGPILAVGFVVTDVANGKPIDVALLDSILPVESEIIVEIAEEQRETFWGAWDNEHIETRQTEANSLAGGRTPHPDDQEFMDAARDGMIRPSVRRRGVPHTGGSDCSDGDE